MVDYFMKQIKDLEKNSTINARKSALKIETLAMHEKKQITIDSAWSYQAIRGDFPSRERNKAWATGR
jgi:hypothetical protein